MRGLPLCFAVLLASAGGLIGEDGRIVPGLNQFATASYRQLAKGNNNLIFSPFSISAALSMTLDGARGQTAAEIAKVLGQKPDPGYHAALASLVDQVLKAANAGGNELLSANGLWVDRRFHIQSDFKQTIQNFYQAPLAQLDFFQNPEAARAEINAWTERNTKGKIRELFGPGSLDPRTRLVLTSAVYFWGRWQSTFRPQDTHPADFRLPGGGTAKANFMSHTAQFAYADTPALQVLEMKYAGGVLAFDILLPKTENGLADLESSLSAGKLADWCKGLQNREVEVSLPKFRLESEFPLRETLSRLGMPGAFSGSADFSGIDDRRDLALSDVRHKAFVDVSEEGTKAAAATGSMVMLISAPIKTRFRADHPFAFVIRDTRTGLIWFAGRLAHPAS